MITTVQNFLYVIDGNQHLDRQSLCWLIVVLMTVVCVEVFKR